MTQPKQLNVDLFKLHNEACKCGNKFYEKSYVLKQVPGLMIGQAQGTVVPIEVYRCDQCKEIHPSLVPAIKEPETKKIIQ